MAEHVRRIRAVPTNIITGFLGTGKTTAILHLLEAKPAGERWAVLINEFGEIGVDGTLVQGQRREENGVFVREVPGGCMCCAAGLPMQVGLNQLLTLARPERLLIEPTGLGHPKQVLQVLTDTYQEVLNVQRILTLVDARQLADERYTTHDTFIQQIQIADVIVGNKCELYQSGDRQRLIDYLTDRGKTATGVVFTTQGRLDPSLLEGAAEPDRTDDHEAIPHQDHPHQNAHDSAVRASDAPWPASGYIKAENAGEHRRSVGWRFKSDRVFRHDCLIAFLSGFDAERMKAVFVTDKGVVGYNLSSGALTEVRLQDGYESRIEIISDLIDDQWEVGLLRCLHHSEVSTPDGRRNN